MDQLKITREKSFLDPKIGADCTFLVGADFAGMEQEISGHKAIFANASPVFNKMFYGSVPEKGDSIKVPEIHPETFLTMVNFFYTGEIIVSLENAIELWYVADKYIIAEILKSLPDFIVEHITPQNVCYIRESSILYRNQIIMEECHKIILVNISTVLNDASFLKANLSTVSFILDQKKLNIPEMDLFKALVRYHNAHNDNNMNNVKSVQTPPPPTSRGKSLPGDLEVKEQIASDSNYLNSCGEVSSNAQGHIEVNGGNQLKDLVKKIRFLNMTPKEFTECLGMSSLISPAEGQNILVNICNPTIGTHPMPEGFCTIREKREFMADSPNIKFRYCPHTKLKHYLTNESTLWSWTPPEFSLDFQCSAKIKMRGVILKLHDGKGRATIEILDEEHHSLYSSTGEVSALWPDFTFYNPVQIDPGLYYTIRVKWQSVYSQSKQCLRDNCLTTWKVNGVFFTFGRFPRPCSCNGVLRSIVFTT